MISIVDYGLGNVSAFIALYKQMNIPAVLASTPGELLKASKLILPGVGSFDHAIELLNASGMRQTLHELALERKVPLLGVCVGMQILARDSEEGKLPGLGWIPGRVRSFGSVEGSSHLPRPHLGWNDVEPVASTRLFLGLEEDRRFYFLHSYFFECDDPSHQVATTSYGIPFASAIQAGNIYGVQFHPEKSHHYGTTLLGNFARN